VATVLGLAGFVVFIICTIALAAGVTWTVVRFSPAPGKPKPAAPGPGPGSSTKD
jgi:hypothetical protein